MDKCNIFAKNIETLQKPMSSKKCEFSDEIGVPPSTLHSVLSLKGNTSLHTALCIADGLNVPLSLLTDELFVSEPDQGTDDNGKSDDRLKIISAFLQISNWFYQLSCEDQKTVAFHANAIMEVIQK